MMLEQTRAFRPGIESTRIDMTRIGNTTDQTVDMSLGVKSPVITHETRDGSDAKPGRDTSTPYNNRYFFLQPMIGFLK